MLTSLAAPSMARSRSGPLILRCVLLHTPRLRRQSGVSSGFPRLPGPNASLLEVPIGVSLSTARRLVVEQVLTISHIASVPVLVYVLFDDLNEHNYPCALIYLMNVITKYLYNKIHLTSVHRLHEKLAHPLEECPEISVVVDQIHLSLQGVPIYLGSRVEYLVVTTGSTQFKPSFCLPIFLQQMAVNKLQPVLTTSTLDP